jgi:hypothetical protein
MINFIGKEAMPCEPQDTRVSTRDLKFRAGSPDREHQRPSHFDESDVASQSAA